ncbi:MAG: PD40 domain-containing protein [Planctomycetes bacterium]|nr:PD40 domain-containing protein [Planctomycetota bacterium]
MCTSANLAHGQFVENIKIIHEVHAEAAGDQFGWIARNISDVDGDGINDFVVSAPFKNIEGPNAGSIYAYSGKTAKLLWKQSAKPNSYLGINIDPAGDVNGDGVGDVIAGAPRAGYANVYSGKDGSILLHLKAKEQGERFGRTVSPAGDVNQDGHDDIIIGAPGNTCKGKDTGRAYLINGKDGEVLRTFDGEEAGDNFSSTIHGYSDENNSFIVIGAMNAGEGDKGRVYVFDGRTGKKRFTVEADETGVNLGRMFVSVVGDVNADGTPDIYSSDWENAAKGEQTGRVYINSGIDGKLLHTFTGEAKGDGFGIGTALAGDVNNDGHADLIIGAWQHASGAKSGGKCYLYSGKDGSLMQTYTCNIKDETFGFDTSAMGDVNSDGTLDFLIASGWSSIKGPKSGRVFVISALPDKPANNTAPSWSPDGKKIAFYSNRDGNYEIYIMNTDGTNQTRLTHTPERDYLPRWSPDGSKIVFFSGSKGQFQIHVMNADGTQTKALTNELCNHEDPSFSYDGSQIYYNTDCDGDHEIYVMNADGTDPKRLSRNTIRDYTPRSSPDGQRIAFVASIDDKFDSPAIHIMNSDGSNRIQLTKTRAESAPIWSPDGAKIAFCSRRDGANDIYLIRPDGTGEQRLTSHPAHDTSITWSPDASKIAFASKRDGSWQIYIMNSDGTNPTPITHGAYQ